MTIGVVSVADENLSLTATFGRALGPSGRGARWRRQRGFTLIEILVALSILALVYGAGLEVFSRGLGALVYSDSAAVAAQLAESKLSELEAAGYEVGESAGEFSDQVVPIKWEATVEPYAQDSLGPSESQRLALVAVQVTVSWSDGARMRSYHVASIGLVERP